MTKRTCVEAVKWPRFGTTKWRSNELYVESSADLRGRSLPNPERGSDPLRIEFVDQIDFEVAFQSKSCEFAGPLPEQRCWSEWLPADGAPARGAVLNTPGKAFPEGGFRTATCQASVPDVGALPGKSNSLPPPSHSLSFSPHLSLPLSSFPLLSLSHCVAPHLRPRPKGLRSWGRPSFRSVSRLLVRAELPLFRPVGRSPWKRRVARGNFKLSKV